MSRAGLCLRIVRQCERAERISVVVVCVLAWALLPGPMDASGADLSTEVQQGRQLADAVRSGQRGCADLSADEFELIGEYAMDQYLGSSAAHEAMNQHMTQVMGAAGEQRMHEILGERRVGCASVSGSGWVMPMLGMMGGDGAASGNGSGMMGGQGRSSMMGGAFPGSDHDEGVNTLGAIGIGVGGVLVGALLVGIGTRIRRPTGGTS